MKYNFSVYQYPMKLTEQQHFILVKHNRNLQCCHRKKKKRHLRRLFNILIKMWFHQELFNNFIFAWYSEVLETPHCLTQVQGHLKARKKNLFVLMNSSACFTNTFLFPQITFEKTDQELVIYSHSHTGTYSPSPSREGCYMVISSHQPSFWYYMCSSSTRHS